MHNCGNREKVIKRKQSETHTHILAHILTHAHTLVLPLMTSHMVNTHARIRTYTHTYI